MVNFSLKIFFKIFKVVNIYLKQQKEKEIKIYFLMVIIVC
mgnify:CR=1 FL=1|jgi:hypothetical protein